METAHSTSFDVITIGRSSIDLYANDIGKPFVDIESFAAYVGGSPTNIAVGTRRLGLRTALLTAVGHDPVGDFILNFLQSEGVDTSYIPRKAGRRTSAVLLGIEPPDRFPLVFYRDNCADIALDIDDIMNTPIAQARVVEVSGTALSQEPSRSAVFLAVEQAQRAGAQVVLDIDFRADQWHDPRAFGVITRALLPLVDVALGTEEEVNAAMLQDPEQIRISHSQMSAPEISGDLDANVRQLLERGPEALVVKRGAQGATIFLQDGDVIDAPGFPVEVFNVLGAGDAFASGFIYGLVKGWNWYRAARMGNACGAIVVTRHGCANFMGYEAEVLDFIRSRGGF
ncbi:MAG TPA: 5-dehydro-2-deoxygluconokinase [Candidatus Sulfomarinibacteraceae bacterium]|nr:5-dehydro-2-deoxygluconokinase [Candidatus Sulfomarinibacteraceae bacterium]